MANGRVNGKRSIINDIREYWDINRARKHSNKRSRIDLQVNEGNCPEIVPNMNEDLEEIQQSNRIGRQSNSSISSRLMNSRRYFAPSQRSSTSHLYRRHYAIGPASDSPVRVELQSPKKRVRLTETESTTPESQSLPPVDFDRDVRDPLESRLSSLFAKLHYLIPSLTSTDSDYFSHEPDRIQTLAEYCEIFNSMHHQLVDRQITRVTFLSSTFSNFSLSHSMLDLYALLWYSPPIHQHSHYENSHRQFRSEIKDPHSDSDSDLLTPSLLSSVISQVKVRLLFWYIKHTRPVPAHRTFDQVMRSMEIFHFESRTVPQIVFEETSNHLARLLLLCNFDEFFHILYLFGTREDSAAQTLIDLLLHPSLSKSPSRYRLIILDPSRHEHFLSSIRSTLISSISSGSLHQTFQHSVFAKSVELLSGDEAKIDRVIFDVFPQCWLASFILGLFWRSFGDPTTLNELCRVLSPGVDELGDIVALFFNSWLDNHPSIQDRGQLQSEQYRPIVNILSSDIENLTCYLRDYPNLIISPLLVDYLSNDHHFKDEEHVSSEIYFRHAQSLFLSSSPSSGIPYILKGLMESKIQSYKNQVCQYHKNYHNRNKCGLTDTTSRKDVDTPNRSSKRYGFVEEDKEDKEENRLESEVDDEIMKLETLNDLSESLLKIVRQENNNDYKKSIGSSTTKESDDDLNIVYEIEGRQFIARNLKFCFMNVPLTKCSGRLMSLCLLMQSMYHVIKPPLIEILSEQFNDFNALMDLFHFVISNDRLSDLVELNEILAELIERSIKLSCLSLRSSCVINLFRFAFLYARIRLLIACLMKAQSEGFCHLSEFINQENNKENDDCFFDIDDNTNAWSWRNSLVEFIAPQIETLELKLTSSRLVEYVIDHSSSDSVLLSLLRDSNYLGLLFHELTSVVYSIRLAFLIKFAKYENVINEMSLRFTFDEYDDNNDFYFTPLKRTQPPADSLDEIRYAVHWILRFTGAIAVPISHLESIFNFLLSVFASSIPIVTLAELKQFSIFWSEYRTGLFPPEYSLPASSPWSPLSKRRPRLMDQAIASLQLESNLVGPSCHVVQCPTSIDCWILNVLDERNKHQV